MAKSLPLVASVGEIARRLGHPVHRIEWVIRSRGIQPVSRCGHIRIFSDAAVRFIEEELACIDARKEEERCGCNSH